jgi:hypothetical protein
MRLTIENISTLPVDYYNLSFDDSTISPAQQALVDGTNDLSVAEVFETEFDLLHRPVFRWLAPTPLPRIPPAGRMVVNVACHGKVGWYVFIRV